jgi:alpha-ribazole phosphatase
MAKDIVPMHELVDGTKKSGFVHGSENKPPRTCGNCIWFGLKSCGHPLILLDPELKDRRNDYDRFPVDEDDCSNAFQSQGNVLLYIVRHGETPSDGAGRHGGWQDEPLSAEGEKQIALTKKYLEGKEYKHVFSSDMKRAIQTAKSISGKNPEKISALRPWDVGVFTNKDQELYEKEFEEYLKHPAREIPDGESLAAYATRLHKALEWLISFARANGPCLVVCHSRNFSQFKKQVEGKNEFNEPDKWDKVKEGGIMTILDEKGELKVEIVFNRGDEKDIIKMNS